MVLVPLVQPSAASSSRLAGPSAAEKWLEVKPEVKQEVDDTATGATGHGTAEPARSVTKEAMMWRIWSLREKLRMSLGEVKQVINETAGHEKKDLGQLLEGMVVPKRVSVPNTEANKRRRTGHEVTVELHDSTNSKGVPGVASAFNLQLPWETPMMKYILGDGPNPMLSKMPPLPGMLGKGSEPTTDAGNASSSTSPERAQETESCGIKGKGVPKCAAKVAAQPQPLAQRYLELQKMLASERERRQTADRDRKLLQERLDAMSKENGRLRAQLQVQKSLSSLSSGASWQFETEGSWEAFTPEGNEKMHQAYLEYLKGIPDSRHAAINSGGVARMVDFELMQQEHLRTQKVRRIRLLTGVPPQWVTPAADLLQQGNELESFYKEVTPVTDQEIWDSVYKILTETGHAWDASKQCSCMRRHRFFQTVVPIMSQGQAVKPSELYYIVYTFTYIHNYILGFWSACWLVALFKPPEGPTVPAPGQWSTPCIASRTTVSGIATGPGWGRCVRTMAPTAFRWPQRSWIWMVPWVFPWFSLSFRFVGKWPQMDNEYIQHESTWRTSQSGHV